MKQEQEVIKQKQVDFFLKNQSELRYEKYSC